MKALHSSSALAVNVFDFWSERPRDPLCRVLGLSAAILGLDFEVKCPTGLGGTPPNLDLVLTLADGSIVGIESKYTEWMVPKKAMASALKAKYFDDARGMWRRVGLDASQRMAENIRGGTETFTWLNAPQLLKHSLGLGTQHKSNFALTYLFYDGPGDTGNDHRTELKRFAEHVGSELRFRWMSYQDLLRDLVATNKDEMRRYRGYLKTRYQLGS
jgi:hypothetical protein